MRFKGTERIQDTTIIVTRANSFHLNIYITLYLHLWPTVLLYCILNSHLPKIISFFRFIILINSVKPYPKWTAIMCADDLFYLLLILKSSNISEPTQILSFHIINKENCLSVDLHFTSRLQRSLEALSFWQFQREHQRWWSAVTIITIVSILVFRHSSIFTRFHPRHPCTLNFCFNTLNVLFSVPQTSLYVLRIIFNIVM